MADAVTEKIRYFLAGQLAVFVLCFRWGVSEFLKKPGKTVMNMGTAIRNRSRGVFREFFELLSQNYVGKQVNWERRYGSRVDYPLPVFLTPIDGQGIVLVDESFGVLGRQISESGFDFYHKEAIPYRLVIASFEYSPDRWLGVKLKINWCRFGRHGYCENGGQFLEIVDSPFGIGPIDS